MGRKKKNLAPHSKQSPAPETAVDGDAANVSTLSKPESGPKHNSNNTSNYLQNQAKVEPLISVNESGGSSYSAIKLECERALTAFRRGNHTRALKLMKELCFRNENSAHSALIHRVQGTVCVKVASIIDDPNAKHRHLKNAIESAHRAVELSPNSIEFAHFYANLLYEAANDAKEYEEVVQECDRALGIENPIDPAKESLQDEKQQKIPNAEARILHVQNELRQLIQKSNLSSLSTWMKNLGNGEEKFRLIPIRRVAEDPMEVRLVQTRRTNEIEKPTKTPEERRKEIEVRVAAARLLQQKSESPHLENDGNKVDRGLDSSSGSVQRVGERRKYGNLRKHGSSAERRDWVRPYWNSMSIDSKKELLRINISDIKAHFLSSKDGSETEVLLEALSFCEANKTWKFWMCCRCNERFSDSESHMHHVVQEHMGNLLPKMQSILPQNVDNEWIEMLLNFSWKPVDVAGAVEMLENQTKCKDPGLAEDLYSEDRNEGFDDCFKDAWDSSTEKGNLDNSCNDCTRQSNNPNKSSNLECKNCREDHGSRAYFLLDNWPIADDSERAKLLERIQSILEMLIRHKYFAPSHLNKVMQITMNELQGLPCGSQLLHHGLDQTPMCICFLGTSQLTKICNFLQELCHSCGLSRYYEKNSGRLDDASSSTQVLETKEKIVLSGDASFLLLDERFLSAEGTPIAGHGAATDDVSSAASSKVVKGNGVIQDVYASLSWIFSGPSSGEQLVSWVRTKEEKTQQGTEILQVLEKEFYHLQSLCERKCEQSSYEEALEAVEDLFLEGGKRRENMTEFVDQSYESVLRKRREELIEAENDVMFLSSRFELEAITNVLKEAERENNNRHGYDEACAVVTSQIRDLESGEDEIWRAKDYLQFDSCIETAIQRLKEQSSVEINKIDARIMRNVTEMQQLELKLEPVSAYDYQSILLPLVRSYLRARLEDLAEKDAKEKSDAATEAFLAELALDSKKSVKGGNDNARHSQEKSKDKKRNKEFRKSKDLKATGGNGQVILHHETVEQVSFLVASNGDLESDITVSENYDDIKLPEEELRRKIELEDEERKLEETLEYQRRIENEAKQKHLAKQQKKSAWTYPEKVSVGQHDIRLRPVSDDGFVIQQFKPDAMEQLAENNACSNNFESLTVNGTAVPSVSGSEMISGTHLPKVKQGLPNGGILENSLPCSDRRTGRRGRRHKASAKLVEGNHLVIPPGKENIEVGNSQFDSHLRKEVIFHGNLIADNVKPVCPLLEDKSNAKPLTQVQPEEDDEERFQSDFKKAVRQSIDEAAAVSMKGSDVFGTGLRNEIGEYNCFLNVIIQSLWHLRRFQDEFLRRSKSEHVHVGDPCVVCALYEIFTALSIASTDTQSEAVAPTTLRIALSKLYPDSNFFQEGQMNDASELLAVIFDCLHRSFTPISNVSDTESTESNWMGSWDCANDACLVHSIFGMDIFERMNCYSCGLESRHLKYTTFFHNINASALRTTKVMCAESSFDQLLNVVEMNHQLACDPEVGGCGKLNYIHHFLSAPPHIFTTVLGWQNTCESAADITSTLAALSTEIDISVLYRGLDPKNIHSLVSVVCYYGQHYHCFAYSREHECWIMYDDRTVKVIGGWADVLNVCEKGHLQPQVLFFEAVN